MSLKNISGIGEKSLKLLNNMGIYNMDDLVRNYPYRFDVLAKRSIEDEKHYDNFVSEAVVESNPMVSFFKGKMNRLSFRCLIQGKIVKVTIFNRAFMKNNIIDEKHKLKEFTYEETFKMVNEEPPEFLAEYIYKIDKTYNLLIDRIIKLQNDNKSLKGEIKVHSKNSNNRYKAIKGQEKYIQKLHLEAQRYFDMFADESIKNYHLETKYDKALELLSEYQMPCDIDEFNIKNADYCSMNCGVDEEIYKKCWKLYIEQELEKEE